MTELPSALVQFLGCLAPHLKHIDLEMRCQANASLPQLATTPRKVLALQLTQGSRSTRL